MNIKEEKKWAAVTVPSLGVLIAYRDDLIWEEKSNYAVRLSYVESGDQWIMVERDTSKTLLGFLKSKPGPETRFLRVSSIGRTGRYVELEILGK